MGALGWLALAWTDLQYMQLMLQLFAGLFMLLMGLYISGLWMGLTRIEKLGARLWKYLQPGAQKLLPVSNPLQALLLGLLWGWLPCGLVYSVLIWSISSGSFVDGGLLMLSFGLGTLPNLLAMGLFANQLKQWVQKQRVRYFSGGLVMLFACWTLYLAVNGLWDS
jgi:sulfite exporter TauE/SafE